MNNKRKIDNILTLMWTRLNCFVGILQSVGGGLVVISCSPLI